MIELHGASSIDKSGETQEVFKMFCPKCGTQNDDAANFCSRCSQPLSGFRAASGSPGTLSGAPTTADQASFATSGTPRPLSSDSSRPTTRKKGMPAWLIGLMCGFAVLVAFFAWAAMSPDDTSVSSKATKETIAEEQTEAAGKDDATMETDSNAEEPLFNAEDISDEGAMAEAEAGADTAGDNAEASAAGRADWISKDIFDWQMMSDDEKRSLAAHFQDIWAESDITGKPLTMTPDELVALIGDNLSEQAIIFWTACDALGIDAAPYYEETGSAK